jgi:sterol desaturase/sphingolipid hydroxylase (fatty acid hydroxylase superfamily)
VEDQVIDRLYPLFAGMTGLAALAMVACRLELRWPIDPGLTAWNAISDWKVTGINVGLTFLVGPLAGACSAAIVRAAGGGLFHLRTDGGWYIVSLVGLVMVIDLYQYWFHRLQHAVPVLWRMHSFHHSAQTLSLITGIRHFWLERTMAIAFLPILPLLFSVPEDMTAAAALIFFLPDACAHF